MSITYKGAVYTKLKFSDDPKHNPNSPEFNHDEPPPPTVETVDEDWLGDDLPPDWYDKAKQHKGAVVYLGAVYVPVLDADGEPVAPPVPEGGYIISATYEKRNDYADEEDRPDERGMLADETSVMSLADVPQELPSRVAWNSYFGVEPTYLFESDSKGTDAHHKSGDYTVFQYWLTRADGQKLTAAEIGYLEAVMGNHAYGKAPVVK